jgi:plasmid stabilization system protein ParE
VRRVRILDAAAEEAIEAAAWYERERPGLGVEFGRALNAALDLLQDAVVPLASVSGAAGAKGAKRLILRRFPYDIVVREFPDEIMVVAIAHHSRRPGYWRDHP